MKVIPEYCKTLSREERASSLRLGMLMKSAEFNNTEGFMKTAVVDLVLNNIIRLSILTGIPLGLAASLIHKKIKEDNLKEKEYAMTAGYYRDATKELEKGLTKDEEEPKPELAAPMVPTGNPAPIAP